MKFNEQILCAARADIPPAWLPHEGAVPLTEEALLDHLASIAPRWLLRAQAETDPTFKQWIPYILIENNRGEFAAYPRKGSESRLHGLYSLGVGGHINPVDTSTLDNAPAREIWQEAIFQGLRRELAEEFPEAVVGETRFLGLINEEASPVGRVHIGLVFHHRIQGTLAAPEGELSRLTWIPRTALGTPARPAARFELWSLLALQLLS